VSVPVNPLVAARVDRPADAWAGVWIAEDVELISQGVRGGDWIDGTLGVVGAGLDALALGSDPVGALLQYGVAWIIEHVRPLTEALDWLVGDPAQISGVARTWHTVAGDLRSEADDLIHAAGLDLTEWTGAAASAYRAWARQRGGVLKTLAVAADALAAITEAAGFLIAAVRIMVRDAITTVVSRLIVYAAEEVASVGLATPLVVEQVTTLVAAWGARISRWLRSLLGSLHDLARESRRLEQLIETLGRLRRRSDESAVPKQRQAPSQKIGGPKEFDPEELRGMSSADVRSRIPEGWERLDSARGGGEVFRDPANNGRQVRIMPGYPPGSRADPMTCGPYVVVSQNGMTVKIPLEGNPAL
jgi:hypothetical protein